MTAIAIIITIIGIFLFLSTFFARRAPIVVVRERSDGGLGVMLLVCSFLWLFFSTKEPGCHHFFQPNTKEADESSNKDTLSINQIPPDISLEYTPPPDTHVNTAPLSRTGAAGAGFKEPDTLAQTIQRIVLVKRLADRDKAKLLQQHFSLWEMKVLKTNDREYPYWNCVFVENEEEGRAKIRQWNRHRRDFEHMGLELTLTQIEIH